MLFSLKISEIFEFFGNSENQQKMAKIRIFGTLILAHFAFYHLISAHLIVYERFEQHRKTIQLNIFTIDIKVLLITF